jgi:SNF2 family DNA or RNA helicase
MCVCVRVFSPYKLCLLIVVYVPLQMGLGKTLQSISVLVYMLEYRNVTGPHLIVVPKSTLSNWMNEIARWAPTLKAVKFHGSREEREETIRRDLEPSQRDEDRTWNVVVTTYEVCLIEKSTLNKFAWSYLIIDEGSCFSEIIIIIHRHGSVSASCLFVNLIRSSVFFLTHALLSLYRIYSPSTQE